MSEEIKPAPTAEEWAEGDGLGITVAVEAWFTWEMVDAIREAVEDAEDQRAGTAHIGALRSVADRIAALLPPRAP